MFSRTRTLSDQQNSLMRKFQPLGKAPGEQFGLIEATFLATDLVQRHRHHHVDFMSSVVVGELVKLVREPVCQRVHLLKLQHNYSANQRIFVAKRTASAVEAKGLQPARSAQRIEIQGRLVLRATRKF